MSRLKEVALGTFLKWLEVEFVSVANNSIGATATGVQFNIGLIILALGGLSVFIFLTRTAWLHAIAAMFGLIALVALSAFLNDPLMFSSDLHDVERAALSEVSEVKTGVYISLVGAVGVIFSGGVSALMKE